MSTNAKNKSNSTIVLVTNIPLQLLDKCVISTISIADLTNAYEAIEALVAPRQDGSACLSVSLSV